MAKEIRLVFIRAYQEDNKQTLGYFYVVSKEGFIRLFGYSLELPDKQNKRNISRIQPGVYKAKKRWSQKFKWHIHITNVPNRSYILIHAGNYYTDIEGCILVGTDWKDINEDGLLDVVNSRFTLNNMLDLLPNDFYVKIKDDNNILLP